MSTVLIISGSPSEQSRTDGVLSHVGRRLTGAGHRVANLVLRDLPAAALLALDVREPRIAQAVAHVADADGIVLGSPIYKAAYSGLAKAFLDVLPQNAFREKSVLPVVTGGSPAHVLAVDYALRPVLTSLGAGHVGQGWFVLSGHVQLFPDGGVLLDPAAAGPLSEVTDAYVRHLGTRSAANLHCGTFGSSKTDVQVRRVRVDDPVLAPLMADLVVEYGTRYGRPPGALSCRTCLRQISFRRTARWWSSPGAARPWRAEPCGARTLAPPRYSGSRPCPGIAAPGWAAGCSLNSRRQPSSSGIR